MFLGMGRTHTSAPSFTEICVKQEDRIWMNLDVLDLLTHRNPRHVRG